jgi:hypothetical protein
MASPPCAVAVVAEPTFGTARPRYGRWPEGSPATAALVVAVSSSAQPASAAVTVGSNTGVLPNRDIVSAVGYELGDTLTVQVLRNGNVKGTAKGPTLEIGKAPVIGYGLEVNHGSAGRDSSSGCTRRTLAPRVSGSSRNTTFAPSAAKPSEALPTVQQASHRPQRDNLVGQGRRHKTNPTDCRSLPARSGLVRVGPAQWPGPAAYPGDQTVVSQDAGQRDDPAPAIGGTVDTPPVSPGNRLTLFVDRR